MSARPWVGVFVTATVAWVVFICLERLTSPPAPVPQPVFVVNKVAKAFVAPPTVAAPERKQVRVVTPPVIPPPQLPPPALR